MSSPDEHLEPQPLPRIIIVISGLTALALLTWAAALLLMIPNLTGGARSAPAIVAALAVAISVTTAQLAIDYVRRRRTENAVLLIEKAARASQDELIEAVGELARESQSSRARVAEMEREMADLKGHLVTSMDALIEAVTQHAAGPNYRDDHGRRGNDADQRRRRAQRSRTKSNAGPNGIPADAPAGLTAEVLHLNRVIQRKIDGNSGATQKPAN